MDERAELTSILENSESIQRNFFRYLIIENWDVDKFGGLDDELMRVYARRLYVLFIKDQDHLSIHDLAYSLCKLGLDSDYEHIYLHAMRLRV